ncbi:MAG: hypothetical protein AAF213_00505 [Pseudomonadota bacterium]
MSTESLRKLVERRNRHAPLWSSFKGDPNTDKHRDEELVARTAFESLGICISEIELQPNGKDQALDAIVTVDGERRIALEICEITCQQSRQKNIEYRNLRERFAEKIDQLGDTEQKQFEEAMKGMRSQFFEHHKELSRLKEYIGFPFYRDWVKADLQQHVVSALERKIRKLSNLVVVPNELYLLLFLEDTISQTLVEQLQVDFNHVIEPFNKVLVLMGYQPGVGYPIFELRNDP